MQHQETDAVLLPCAQQAGETGSRNHHQRLAEEFISILPVELEMQLETAELMLEEHGYDISAALDACYGGVDDEQSYSRPVSVKEDTARGSEDRPGTNMVRSVDADNIEAASKNAISRFAATVIGQSNNGSSYDIQQSMAPDDASQPPEHAFQEHHGANAPISAAAECAVLRHMDEPSPGDALDMPGGAFSSLHTHALLDAGASACTPLCRRAPSDTNAIEICDVGCNGGNIKSAGDVLIGGAFTWKQEAANRRWNRAGCGTPRNTEPQAKAPPSWDGSRTPFTNESLTHATGLQSNDDASCTYSYDARKSITSIETLRERVRADTKKRNDIRARCSSTSATESLTPMHPDEHPQQRVFHEIEECPPGWRKEVVYRITGYPGQHDCYYYAPCGQKLRSTPEIHRHLKVHPECARDEFSDGRFTISWKRKRSHNSS